MTKNKCISTQSPLINVNIPKKMIHVRHELDLSNKTFIVPRDCCLQDVYIRTGPNNIINLYCNGQLQFQHMSDSSGYLSEVGIHCQYLIRLYEGDVLLLADMNKTVVNVSMLFMYEETDIMDTFRKLQLLCD